MARPKKKIDWSLVDKYLMAGATGTEIAAYLGIHPDTLYLRCEKDNKIGFSDYLTAKRSKGDGLLKVKQYDLAMNGDRAMLIWLGKNRLGQADKKEVKAENEVNVKAESLNLDKLNNDELEALDNIFEKLAPKDQSKESE